MFKNKKAQLEALAYFVLFSAVFIIIVILVKSFLGASSTELDVNKCQSSLLLTKGVSSLRPHCSVGSLTPFNLECTRSFIEINAGVVKKNGKDITKNYDPTCKDNSNSCITENVIASEMALCWKTFFEGKQQVMQQLEQAAFLKFLNRKDHVNACFIFSEITITDNRPDIKDYLQYKMMKNNISYYDYFAKSPGAWCENEYRDKFQTTCWDGMRSGNDTSAAGSFFGYSTTKPSLIGPLKSGVYAVVFVRKGVGSCAGASENGESTLTNTVQLIPSEKVVDYCDVVMS